VYVHCIDIRSGAPVQGASMVDSRTIVAIQIGKFKDVGRTALHVAISTTANSDLALLKGRESKRQSNESSKSDERLHVGR
jgi:hypothetical protein